MRNAACLLTALTAGIAAATGFAPLNLWPVTLLALAVLLWLIHTAPNLHTAVVRGWLFGVGHFTLGNNWIQHAFTYQDKMPPILGYFAVALLALYLALFPALTAGLCWRFARHGKHPDAAFILTAAAVWIGSEWLRATLFTGYAWNPLAVIWLPVPGVVHLAVWIGTYALSGVTVLTAGALLLAVYGRWRLPVSVLLPLGLAAAFAAPGPAPTRPDAPLVRVVQPNIRQELVGTDAYAEQALTRLIALSGTPGPRPRLIVWPEGMVTPYVEDGYPPWYELDDPRQVRDRIAAVLGPHDRMLISGTALFFDARGNVTGGSVAIWPLDSSGRLGPRYDKAHLVPYGEYLPLRSLLGPLGLARLVTMGDIDLVPGPGPRTIDVPGFGPVGMQVCYEIIFSGAVVDPARRPALLFNPSNDAWFGSWGPPQHLAQARLRAIEEGLPILRATPTGISAVIDADGRLLGTVPHGQAGVVELPLPAPRPATLFSRFGNLLALAVATALIMMAIAIRRFLR